MKEYWQDKHIKEDNGKFICFDERGEYYSTANTMDEAREQLDFYDTYILSNNTD